MRLMLWISSLWPGCWHAWQLGSWRGLAVAAAFGAALNGALVTTFIWPEWMAVGAPRTVTLALSWTMVLGLWALGRTWLRYDAAQQTPAGAEQRQTLNGLFVEAQHEYLKGHWIETETLLGRVLAADASDVEARLLLAGVQRRTKRWDEARHNLQRLLDDEAASVWRMEIETELERIKELKGDTLAESGVQGESASDTRRAA